MDWKVDCKNFTAGISCLVLVLLLCQDLYAIDSDSLSPRIWSDLRQELLEGDASTIRSRLVSYTEKYSEAQLYQKEFLRLAFEMLNSSSSLRSDDGGTNTVSREVRQQIENMEEELYWLDVKKRTIEKKIPEANASGERWFSDNDRSAATRKKEAEQAVAELDRQLGENNSRIARLKTELEQFKNQVEAARRQKEVEHRRRQQQANRSRATLKQEIHGYAQEQFKELRYAEVIALLHIWDQAVQPDPEMTDLSARASREKERLEVANRMSADVMDKMSKQLILEHHWDALETGDRALREYQLTVEDPALLEVIANLLRAKLKPARARVLNIEKDFQHILKLASTDARTAYPKFQDLVEAYPDRRANAADLGNLRQLLTQQMSERLQLQFTVINELAEHDPEQALEMIREMQTVSVSEEEAFILEVQETKMKTVWLNRSRDSIASEFQMAEALVDTYLVLHPGDSGKSLLPHVSMSALGNDDIEQVESSIEIMRQAERRLSQLMEEEMDSMSRRELQTFCKTADLKQEFAQKVYANHRVNRLASAVFFSVLAVLAVFLPVYVRANYRKWFRGN